MVLYVLRHAKTDLNTEHRAQGRGGKPLNEEGRIEAKALFDRFCSEGIHFDYIYSSPQERAVQTAKICSGREDIIIDERLNVYDLGSANGLPMSEIIITGTVPDMEIYTGVEELEHYKTRIHSFVNEILEKYKNTVYNILIVCHKDSSGMIEAIFKGIPIHTIYDDYLKFSSKNCEYKVYDIKASDIELTEI